MLRSALIKKPHQLWDSQLGSIYAKSSWGKYSLIERNERLNTIIRLVILFTSNATLLYKKETYPTLLKPKNIEKL